MGSVGDPIVTGSARGIGRATAELLLGKPKASYQIGATSFRSFW